MSELALIENIVKFDGEKLINFEPVTDQFVVEIPNVELKTKAGILKTDAQIAREMEGVLGEYFKVVAVGPDCKSIKLGDNVFLIPPTKVVSFKTKYIDPNQVVEEGKEPVVTYKRFALFKEYVVLGKLSV